MEQLHRVDVFVLYDDVQFDKGGWRNRNRIKTPQGAQWLTVPVLHPAEGPQQIRDVRIHQATNWPRKHWKSIQQNYSKAAYFDDYAPELHAILHKGHEFLLDLDVELIHWLAEAMGIDTPTVLSSELAVSGGRIERLAGIIRALGGSRFYEGAAGRDYIDPSEFERAGITVSFQDFQHPVYPQLHGHFISHLSSIDLLLNCGPESLAIVTGERARNHS